MKSGLAGKIIGLVVSIGLIVGGLSGAMVLRGTDSSAALTVLGFVFLAGDIYALATHNKNKKQGEDGAPSAGMSAGGQPFPAAGPQMTFSQTFPQSGGAAVQNLPQKPMRAVWVMCAAVLFMLLGAYLFLPRLSGSRGFDMTMQLSGFYFPLLLGAGVTLMLRNEAKYKIIAGAGIVFGSIFYAISHADLTIFARTFEHPPFDSLLGTPQFGAYLRLSLLIAVFVGAIALVIAAVHKGRFEKKLMTSVWVSAAALFILRIFNARYAFIGPVMAPIRRAGIIVECIADAGCLALFALLVAMFCSLREKEVNTGVGTKIWLCVCALFTAGAATPNIGFRGGSAAEMIMALVGIAGCMLLILSKRAGFPILLITALLTVASGVCAGLTGGQPSVITAVFPLLGFANPAVTWLLIRKEWTAERTPG